MGWEWRLFSPLPIEAGVIPLEGEREDIYFPATEEVGLKLRRGKGQLEVKLRASKLEIPDRGAAEKWRKQCLPASCVRAGPSSTIVLDADSIATAAAGAFDLKKGGRGATAAATAAVAASASTDVKATGGAEHAAAALEGALQAACHTPLRDMRVRVRKRRKYTPHGESTECVFIVEIVSATGNGVGSQAPEAALGDTERSALGARGAVAVAPNLGMPPMAAATEHTATATETATDGRWRAVVLVERWQSVSVEVKGKDNMRTAVLGTEMPDDAIVIGYPGMVLKMAQKAQGVLAGVCKPCVCIADSGQHRPAVALSRRTGNAAETCEAKHNSFDRVNTRRPSAQCSIG